MSAMRTIAYLPSLLALCLAVSCGGDPTGKTGEDAKKAAEGVSDGDKADHGADRNADKDKKVGEAAVDGADKAEAGGAPTPSADAAGNVVASAGAGDPAGADPGEAAVSAGEAASAGDEAAGVNKEEETKAAIAALLKTAARKRTSDSKAEKALAEAEELGAEPRELAEAANSRGEALFGERDRAIQFFEWARDKDEKYPDPSFNLAKIEVLAGNVPATIAHLQEVKKRGGRKLLKTVGYDPLFEVVKDDRTVQKLIR
ncbi:MAG TPA: hypothetical protein ENK31_05955 [Nannocystis exedens]|nr:hypothetical protein [Nannocystis exedens]